MKKLLTVLTVFILVLLIGCTGTFSDAGKDGDLNLVYDGIVEKITSNLREVGYTDEDFADEILPGYLVVDLKSQTQNPYAELIDFDKVEAAFTIRSGWDTSADRITVFKVSDPSYLSVVKEVFEEEKAGQYEIWEQYIQEEFQKVKNTLIEIEGNLVYYITYRDSEDIEEIILSSFK